MQETASLTQKQEAFVLALIAANGSVSLAAKTCKINESTAHRWLKRSEVKAALNAARREAYSASMTALTDLVEPAILLLKIVLGDKKAGYNVRLRAVQLILEHSHAHFVDEELEQRLAALETVS